MKEIMKYAKTEDEITEMFDNIMKLMKATKEQLEKEEEMPEETEEEPEKEEPEEETEEEPEEEETEEIKESANPDPDVDVSPDPGENTWLTRVKKMRMKPKQKRMKERVRTPQSKTQEDELLKTESERDIIEKILKESNNNVVLTEGKQNLIVEDEEGVNLMFNRMRKLAGIK